MYKCLESRVITIDDVSAEKLGVMHAFLLDFQCDQANQIFDCLEYFVLKAGVEAGDKELGVNVGYGFVVLSPQAERNSIE